MEASAKFPLTMKWQAGRQGTGYRKLELFLYHNWDMYLIYYPPNTCIPTHTDKVLGKQHYRLNILLWGEDKFKGETLFATKRIKLFRPDIMPHSVEKVSSKRLVFSIGWVL